MKLYVQNGSFVSPRFSVSADPEVAQQCRVISAVDRFAKLGRIKLWPRPPVPGMSAVLAVLGEEIHDMLLGHQGVAAALRRAQARAEQALDRLELPQRQARPAPRYPE
jgi:multiple sugar transport system substrate-binding protein